MIKILLHQKIKIQIRLIMIVTKMILTPLILKIKKIPQLKIKKYKNILGYKRTDLNSIKI
jgi:hypothetical protein